MVYAPALSSLLAQLGIPAIFALASWIASATILQGQGAELEAKLDRVLHTSGLQSLKAWLDLKDFLSLLLATPAVQAAIAEGGGVAAQVLAAVDSWITGKVMSQIPPLTFPSFSSLQEADEYMAVWYELRTNYLIDVATYNQARAWYDSETNRLLTGAPAVAVPVAVPAEVPAVTPAVPAVTPVAPTVLLTPTINVTTPPITIPPTIVNVPPMAAPDVNVWPQVDLSGVATMIVPAIAALAGTFVGTLENNIGNISHKASLGRNACYGATASALIRNLAPIALSGLSVAAMSDEGAVGGFIKDMGQKWFETALEPGRFPSPATPETVMAAASQRLMEAMSFGLQAHMWGIVSESNFVTKHLGLGQVAGFLADLAGFSRVAQAVLGQVENAALAVPMRYYANREYRPWIPGLADLELMYAKKEIPYEAREGTLGLHQALALHGYSDEWAGVFREHLWNDPRLTEVIRIGQFFSPALVEGLRLPDAETAAWMRRANLSEAYITSSDWYFAWRAAKAGYDPRDVPILVETAKRATARREQTLFLDASTRLRRESYISSERLLELVMEAWEFSNPIEARIRATELQEEAYVKSATTSMVLAAMTHGLLSRQEARDQLTGLGMDPARAELRIVSATVGLLPRVSMEVAGAGGELEDYDLETL